MFSGVAGGLEGGAVPCRHQQPADPGPRVTGRHELPCDPQEQQLQWPFPEPAPSGGQRRRGRARRRGTFTPGRRQRGVPLRGRLPRDLAGQRRRHEPGQDPAPARRPGSAHDSMSTQRGSLQGQNGVVVACPGESLVLCHAPATPVTNRYKQTIA